MTTEKDDEIIQDEELDSAAESEETVEAAQEELDDFDTDGTEDGMGDPLNLQSPEMAAKMQVMHESLPLAGQLEAAIFASPNPLKAEDLLNLCSHKISVSEIEAELANIKAYYEQRQGGFTLEFVKGLGYQFQSTALAAPIMATMFASRPRPLSRAALETLSIIAYRQPCTRAVVEFIRGVDSGSIIKNLLERNLIKCVGRKEDAGRPMLFGTTDEFLHVFGISSIKDLPPLSAFQPTSDTMKEALKELDQIDAVAVEEFVEDGTEVQPEFGSGLLDDESVVPPEESLESPDKIEGAVLADESSLDEERTGAESTQDDTLISTQTDESVEEDT